MNPFRAVRVDEIWNSVHGTRDLQHLKDTSYSVQLLDQGMILNMLRMMTL